MFEKLKAICEVSVAKKLQDLLTKFYTTSFVKDVDTTASKLTQLQNEITVIKAEEKPSDTVKKSRLLSCLLREFYSIVTAIKALGLANISFEDLT